MKKIQKNTFLAIYPGTFLGPKKFPKIFWLQLVPDTTIQKKILKT
jgi:hypothetical protein